MVITLGTLCLIASVIGLFAIMLFGIWHSVCDGYSDWREDCKKQKNKA